MGIDKSDLLIDDDTTFLQTLVQQSTLATGKVVVAVGQGQLQRYQQKYAGLVGFDQIIWAEDSVGNQGPMEGIHQGLKLLEENFSTCELAFVTGCDVPQFNIGLVHELLLRMGDHDAITPVAGKRIYGMTAIYKTKLWQQAQQFVDSQQLRVSTLAASIDSVAVDLESLRTVDPMLNSFENINLPDDYFGYLAKNSIVCTELMKQQFTSDTKPKP